MGYTPAHARHESSLSSLSLSGNTVNTFPYVDRPDTNDTHPLVQTTPHHTQLPPRAMQPEGKPRGPDLRVVSS